MPKKTLYLDGIIVGEVEQTGDVQKDVAVARDFLKSKGLLKEITLQQAMFRQARSFANTAIILQRDLLKIPADVLSIAPFVVNSAFSIELYLKTLLALTGTTANGHSLLKLYDKLPDRANAVIFSVAKDFAEKYQVIVKQRSDLRQFVAELNTTFVEWRYIYEKGSSPVFHIWPTILVMHAAHEACIRLGVNGDLLNV